MGFWKAVFGGKELSPEEERHEAEEHNFDLLKYDGVKAMKIGQNGYAVRCLQEALKVKEDLETRDYLQQALVNEGRLEEAMQELQVMAAAEPDNVNVMLQMAHVAFMLEDYGHMEEICRQALEVDSENGRAMLLSARAAIGLQQPEKAVETLTKAVDHYDVDADARLLRAHTLLGMGRVEEADADATWLVDYAGEHEDVLLLKAKVEMAKGCQEEAEKLLGMVIEVNPFSAEAYRCRGDLYAAMGREEEAENDRRQARELNPELGNEDIEQQVRQAYKNASPFGV